MVPPTESALLRLVLASRYYQVALPKLNVMAVDELLCGFNRGLVIGAIEQNRPNEMAVAADNVHSIIGHLRYPCRRKFRPLSVHKIPRMSVRFPTPEQIRPLPNSD